MPTDGLLGGVPQCSNCGGDPDKIVADGCWCDDCQALTTREQRSRTFVLPPEGFYRLAAYAALLIILGLVIL